MLQFFCHKFKLHRGKDHCIEHAHTKKRTQSSRQTILKVQPEVTPILDIVSVVNRSLSTTRYIFYYFFEICV